MKKIVAMSTALVLSMASFAQNDQIQNKNDVDIMPVSGEIGVGMNAIPMLVWTGNLFGLTTSNDTIGSDKFINYFGSQTLFGKYMLTDDNAVRVHLRYGQNNFSSYNYIFSDVSGNPDSLVADNYRAKATEFNIGLGYEFRRGKTRLRGIYGGELLYQYSMFKENFTYANGFGTTNASPTTTTWSNGVGIGANNNGIRPRSTVSGGTNGLGLRLFGGVEYYIAPKICLGTEFGWGIGGSWSKAGTSVDEWWDPNADGGNGAVMTTESSLDYVNAFSIDTDNFNGALYLMFWF